MSKVGKRIIIFLIICIILLTFFSIRIISMQTQNLEVENELNTGIEKKIFNLTDQNYPNSPKEVLEVYLEGYALIYGDYRDDTKVIDYVIKKQRLLLSEKILKINSAKKHKQNTIKSLKYLLEQNLKIINIKIESFIEDKEDKNKGTIKVIKTDSNNENYNFTYYLEKDETEKWKIFYWENSNSKHKL